MSTTLGMSEKCMGRRVMVPFFIVVVVAVVVVVVVVAVVIFERA